MNCLTLHVIDIFIRHQSESEEYTKYISKSKTVKIYEKQKYKHS